MVVQSDKTLLLEIEHGRVVECLEGTVAFDRPRVLRADGTEQAVDDFVGDGRRWWEASRALEPRLSTEA